MIGDLVLALGLVVVIEGLALALLPGRVEDAMRMLSSLKPDTRRLIGLASLAIGVLIVWIARNLL